MMDHFIRDLCPGWACFYRDDGIIYSSPIPFSNEIEKGRLVMYLHPYSFPFIKGRWSRLVRDGWVSLHRDEMVDHFIRGFCPGWASFYRDEIISYPSPIPFSKIIEKGVFINEYLAHDFNRG